MSRSTLPALLPRAGARESFALLGRLLLEHPVLLALVCAAGLVSALAGLVAPWVIGRLVDALPDAGAQAVWTGAAAVIGAGVVAAVCAWAGQAWLAALAEPTVARLREMVMERSLNLGAAQQERSDSGDLVSRVAEDSRMISEAATVVVPLVLQSLFTVIVTGAGMTALDWRLGLVGLTAIPMYWLTLRWYLPRSGPIYREEREAFGERAGRLLGGITGARTLRAFDAEHAELARIDAASARARDLSIGVFSFLTRAFSRNNRAEAVVLGLIIITGFLLVSGDAVTAGAVTTAALLFHRLFNPIGALVGMFDAVQSAGASLTRMVGVITVEAPERTATFPAVTAAGVLELHGISHAYGDGVPVLADIDLTLDPGEVVAVVGTTGAGKSTLARIAAGLTEPITGTARYCGVELSTVETALLRTRITMVSQDVHCFAASLADNVRIPRPEADDDAVRAALDAVGAEWVSALPDGIDTVIGEGGHLLDPMQSQMVALARVIIAAPDVVVLDEATAEAGSSGSRRLDAAAARVLESRTGLVVAHRLSQAARADRVLVMEAGRIVESGTHDELRSAGGRYERLCRAWYGEG